MSRATAVSIRRATVSDAEAVAAVVVKAARMGNARDYSEAQLDHLLDGFTLREVTNKITSRETFVAIDAVGAIVGTAAYFDGFIRAVFVDPGRHGAGIGRALVDAAEEAARRDDRQRIEVRSSLTAVGFYERRGYVRVRDVPEGVPTVLMEKALTPS